MVRMILLALACPFIVHGADLIANINIIDYFTTSDNLLGLYCDSYHVYGVDPWDDELEAYHFNGTPYGNLPIDYATYPNPWGMCLVPTGPTYYTDFVSNSIYYTDGMNWFSFVDPAGIYGRGLDYDGQYIWEADCDYSGNGNGIYRFETNGTGAVFYATPEPQGYLTGLTRFSFDGTEYVMVTASQDFNFYFYRTDGTFAGSAPVPFTISYGYGIQYCAATDTFFFSCVSYGNYCIYQLEFEFSLGLENGTWGSVKYSF